MTNAPCPPSAPRPAAGPPEQPARAALLGHDLRASVSDILGGIRLIDAGRFDEATRLQLERVRVAAESLAALLEEGLSLMLGEAHSAAQRGATLSLDRLLADAELRWAGRAREKNLGFVLDRGPGLPERVALDRIAMERILSNLLMNAIRYSEAGTVRLAVTMEPGDVLRLRVEDDGPGFPDHVLAGGAPPQRGAEGGAASGGSGLGLHITREMAGRLSGSIRLANRPGGGAAVTLDLPPEAWRAGPAEAPAAPPPLPDLSGLRVLVAEDSATNQALMQAMLRRMGAAPVPAADGIEAIARLAEGPMGLALVDIEMPRLSGLEVIRWIRAQPAPLARLPVLAVTAYMLRANREVIFAAGADGILPKPIHGIESFGQAIAAALARVRGEPALYTPAPEGLAIDSARFARLLDLAGPEGADDLIARLGSDLSAIERGLVQGLGTPDPAAVRAHTHVLIALAGAVGAAELQRLAEALNGAAHRGGAEAMAVLGADTLSQLDHLIHFIAGERDRRRGAAR